AEPRPAARHGGAARPAQHRPDRRRLAPGPPGRPDRLGASRFDDLPAAAAHWGGAAAAARPAGTAAGPADTAAPTAGPGRREEPHPAQPRPGRPAPRSTVSGTNAALAVGAALPRAEGPARRSGDGSRGRPRRFPGHLVLGVVGRLLPERREF